MTTISRLSSLCRYNYLRDTLRTWHTAPLMPRVYSCYVARLDTNVYMLVYSSWYARQCPPRFTFTKFPTTIQHTPNHKINGAHIFGSPVDRALSLRWWSFEFVVWKKNTLWQRETIKCVVMHLEARCSKTRKQEVTESRLAHIRPIAGGSSKSRQRVNKPRPALTTTALRSERRTAASGPRRPTRTDPTSHRTYTTTHIHSPLVQYLCLFESDQTDLLPNVYNVHKVDESHICSRAAC